MPVRLLDSHTVNQIAAGEVVERPSSVLKELIENSLDAGARRVEIALEDSGKDLIRVRDDGGGMSGEDAMAALQRHATSKIECADDLHSVKTLGFRGEALPSIASVSRFSVSTGEVDGARTVIRVAGGEVQEPAGAAGPRGTEIEVRELFFNTPARLKFLKSDTTELGQCLDVVSRYAIGYPHVAFTLTHNGQNALQTTGSGDMQEAIGAVWGREMARSLAEVCTTLGDLRVTGFVSPPHINRPTRAYQYVFVNGRPCKSRMMTAALDQAYRDLTPERRYPVLSLLLDIDPALVDVNVSPTKSEVKFQREGQVFDAIRIAIRSALMDHGMMPSALDVEAANEALRVALGGGRSFGEPSAVNPAPFALVEAPMPASGVMAPTLDRSEGLPFAALLDGLRVIGQAMNTFIIAETSRGVVIIDQHVAHERILYEYLSGLKRSSMIEQQPLLVPETLHLDRRAAVLLREKVGELEAVGFALEPFGGESYVVRAVPAAIRNKAPLKILRDLVDELVESSVTRKLVPTREQIWITTACHMAVKAGDPLGHAEMEKLIVDLASTENPYMCPHGRPITITLTTDELLRRFKRT